MYTELENYIGQQVLPGVATLSNKRKELLDKIAGTIKKQEGAKHTTKLLFVCTHNSRRSQFAQAWAWVAQQWYKVDHVESHSAGTEVTAFHTNALEALRRAGMKYEQAETNEAKLYMADDIAPAVFFSKLYTDKSIPSEAPIAVMTCADAAKNCPFIPGAMARVSLSYKDPGHADNTEQVEETYDRSCLLIATEIFYLFQQLH